MLVSDKFKTIKVRYIIINKKMIQQDFTYTYSITMELKDKDYVAQFCNEYLRDIEYTSWPDYCKLMIDWNDDFQNENLKVTKKAI